MNILEDVIKNTRPSVPLEELKKYALVKAKIDGEKNDQVNKKNQIGFK
jgi:transitional endoplasmic reticulum ATPase